MDPKFLRDAWHILPWNARMRILLIVVAQRCRFPKSIKFTLRATLLSVALLLILPEHPMTIPTAIGGGISFAMLIIVDR